MYHRDFGTILYYLPALLQGLRVSIKLTLWVLLFGTFIGLLLTSLRFSKFKVLKYVARGLIDLFIALPVLVTLFRIYYTLPIVSGLTIPAFQTAVIALSINLAAFSSDIFASAYLAVPKSQIESGIMFNFSKRQLLRTIIIPQMLKVVVSPMSGRYVETIKLTALASIISVNELLHVGQNIISLTYRPIEIYTAIAVLYMLIIFPCIYGLRYVEKRYSL